MRSRPVIEASEAEYSLVERGSSVKAYLAQDLTEKPGRATSDFGLAGIQSKDRTLVATTAKA